MDESGSNWLAWARRIRAIAQTGRSYSNDRYDRERFDELAVIARQMLAQLTDSSIATIEDIFLPEKGYPTPKVDVRAGVFDAHGRVLLVREAGDGRWSLPGGWADEQETPRAACEREVREESGCIVRATRLVAVKDRTQHPYTPPRLEHVYKLFFLCDWVGPGALVVGETTEAAFWERAELPELSLARTLPEDIQLLWQHQLDAGLSCFFD